MLTCKCQQQILYNQCIYISSPPTFRLHFASKSICHVYKCHSRSTWKFKLTTSSTVLANIHALVSPFHIENMHVGTMKHSDHIERRDNKRRPNYTWTHSNGKRQERNLNHKATWIRLHHRRKSKFAHWYLHMSNDKKGFRLAMFLVRVVGSLQWTINHRQSSMITQVLYWRFLFKIMARGT